MAKPCPKHTAQDPHETNEVSLGPTLKYDYCDKCKEDVQYIAREMRQEWDEEKSQWVARKNPAPQPNAPVANRPVGGLDIDGDDDADGLDQHGNPPNWNPRPQRNMGNGNHHIVLHNDDDSAAHLVMQILCEVFQKNPLEADYLMKGAHFNGQVTVFQCADQAQAQQYLDRIDLLKQDIANEGGVGANTLGNLRFTVDVVN